VKTPRIVIVGGGFAGVACAAELQRARPAVEIVLFSAENHIVFTPLLAEVVGAALNPLDVVVPLRHLLPRVHCRAEEITAVDSAAHEVEFAGADGRAVRLGYEHLVLACGNVARLSVVPGMADHAFPLKGIGDAIALRAHVLEQLERAETCSDPIRQRWHLSFTVVGGGYSGVEAAGEIADLVRGSARHYRNFRAAYATITIIHSRAELLPEIGADLRRFAREALERRGIRVVLGARVVAATGDGVVLDGGELVRGGTIVCTVGSSPSPLIERLALPKESGRLVTQPDMRVSAHGEVWATGDCARIINAATGEPSASSGQFAERQGRQCARNILSALRGKPTRPFFFKPLGQLCSLGGHSAVAEFRGFRLSGLFAWFLWRGVYWSKLPTWGRRLQVGAAWAWQSWFPRDLAHMRARPTDRVSRAHYQPGDIILRPEEIPPHLLVIEKGDVEILRSNMPASPRECLGVLGPSSFLGEKAFLSRESFGLIARARTAVEVTVMGRHVLTQLSASLAPLRHALAATLRRDSAEPWKPRPEVFAALRRGSIHDLMEPCPTPLLSLDATLDEVGRAFAAGNNEFFYVCDPDGRLMGIVTMTDWTRAAASPVATTAPVTQFMTRQPVAVFASDELTTAVALLREYELKHLPVVDGRETRLLMGALRARRIMAHVYATPVMRRELQPIAA
jgi:NADH:ubiquinone reductase (H+-translocating)